MKESARLQREQSRSESAIGDARKGRATFSTVSRRPLNLNDAYSPALKLSRRVGPSLPHSLQPKLTINEPGDQYEHEADRVAEQVMRMPAIRLQRRCACGGSSTQGESCEECAGQSVQLQRQTPPGSESAMRAPDIVHEVLREPGQPLGQNTRAFFEERFAQDFSQVRVHTDDRAAKSARAVNALAYTVGRDVVFGAGQYSPTTSAGQRMLAHELTHVVQQSSAPSSVHMHQESRVLQRYGHTPSCDTKAHLEPFVWPGHDFAKKVTQRALEETDGRTLHPKVVMYLKSLFGQSATDPATVATINKNFVRIQNSLNEQYLYHCAKNRESPEADAVECKVQNASTNPSGRRDITLCFDQLKGWSIPAAAWVIVHENVHRVLGPGHDWEAGKVDKCVMNPPAPVNLQINNPDAYACFAVLVFDLS